MLMYYLVHEREPGIMSTIFKAIQACILPEGGYAATIKGGQVTDPAHGPILDQLDLALGNFGFWVPNRSTILKPPSRWNFF